MELEHTSGDRRNPEMDSGAHTFKSWPLLKPIKNKKQLLVQANACSLQINTINFNFLKFKVEKQSTSIKLMGKISHAL